MAPSTLRLAAATILAAALVFPAHGQAPAPAPAVPVAEQIAAVTNAAEFRAARWGVHAVALDTGETVYSSDASRLFIPASNMKLYTTALALARLGPAYRWRTSVYASEKPTEGGRVAGDLVVYGRGDPTISPRFGEGTVARKIEMLADRVAAAGVRRVDGNLVVDESYFPGVRFGFGWEWNDLQWGYGAEVSALTINDNVVALEFAPAAKPGLPVKVTLAPETSHVRVTNRVTTAPKDAQPKLGIYRAEGSNVVDVWGTLAAGAKPSTATVAVHDPAALFGDLLRAALERRKIVVKGKTQSVDARFRELKPFDPSSAVELASLESDPLVDVVRETNKDSQNLYAELLLRTVGRVAGPADAESAEAAGVAVMTDYLREAGVDPATLELVDGSGLSRRNLVTPEATVHLLAFARRQSYGDAFFASMPEAGLDGTLERRFKDSAAVGRVRAKTGTHDGASSLSGYLVTRSGRPIAFSVMINNAPFPAKRLRDAIDAIVLALVEQ